MIESSARWIDKYRVDGFRIDTAQHVNPGVLAEVRSGDARRTRESDGIPHFHIFGEVATDDMDPAHTAENTRVDKLPSVLDFAFLRAVATSSRAMPAPTNWRKLFRADALYDGGAEAALQLPTFVSNHDCRALRVG